MHLSAISMMTRVSTSIAIWTKSLCALIWPQCGPPAFSSPCCGSSPFFYPCCGFCASSSSSLLNSPQPLCRADAARPLSWILALSGTWNWSWTWSWTWSWNWSRTWSWSETASCVFWCACVLASPACSAAWRAKPGAGSTCPAAHRIAFCTCHRLRA